MGRRYGQVSELIASLARSGVPQKAADRAPTAMRDRPVNRLELDSTPVRKAQQLLGDRRAAAPPPGDALPPGVSPHRGRDQASGSLGDDFSQLDQSDSSQKF